MQNKVCRLQCCVSVIWCRELIALERWLPYACSDSLRQVPMCGHAAPSLLQFHGMNEVCVCKIKREPAKIDCLHSSHIALNSFCVHGMYVQVCMHDCVSDTVYDVIPVFWGNAHKYRYHHYVEKLCTVLNKSNNPANRRQHASKKSTRASKEITRTSVECTRNLAPYYMPLNVRNCLHQNVRKSVLQRRTI